MLPGDINDKGVVNNSDVTAIREEWKDAKPTIFGDIIGNGMVNSSDYSEARRTPRHEAAEAGRQGQESQALVHDRVRQHVVVKSRG